MLNNFIYAKKKSHFLNELEAGNVLDEAIVFIEDTKEIWNHGTYFGGNAVDLSDIEKSIQDITTKCDTKIYTLESTVSAHGSLFNSKANKTEIPTKVSQLENDANYIQDDIVSDGVYAVKPNGSLVGIDKADTSCIGVAFISDNQKVMIPKTDATDGPNTTLLWGKNFYNQNVPNLENLADNTAAKADYNGKANTAAIIAGYAALGKDMDSRDMCKVLETYNEAGYTDWYIPACGQLCEFYSNKTAINAALAKIGGTALNESANYWSSSEFDVTNAWYVYFPNGSVFVAYKHFDKLVRFIRDISVSKPLKERVSDLESQLGDINTILESIINGGSGLSLITFTINLNEYQAVEGMTWEEWVNSDYNSLGFVVSENYILNNLGEYIVLVSAKVLKNQVITANEKYLTELKGMSGGS